MKLHKAVREDNLFEGTKEEPLLTRFDEFNKIFNIIKKLKVNIKLKPISTIKN